MKLYKKIVALALLSFAGSATAANVDGVWKTAPKDPDQVYVEVEIAPCDNKPNLRCGLVTRFFANGEAHEDEIVGKWIIMDMEKSSAELWKGGTVWAPDDDKTYSAKMELLNQNTLKVSGCVFGGFFCRGEEWTRAE